MGNFWMVRKGRGNEPELYGNYQEPPRQEPRPSQPAPVKTQAPTRIERIIGFGNGYLDVLMNDGNRYRRQGGTISWRNCNEGNLKIGNFARSKGAIGAGWGNHAVFPTLEISRKAKYDLLFTPIRGYNNLTILQAMNKYAPISDKGKGVPKGGNQPNKYATFIGKALNVSTSTKLSHLSENKKQQMLDAMRRYEGFKQGTIKRI